MNTLICSLSHLFFRLLFCTKFQWVIVGGRTENVPYVTACRRWKMRLRRIISSETNHAKLWRTLTKLHAKTRKSVATMSLKTVRFTMHRTIQRSQNCLHRRQYPPRLTWQTLNQTTEWTTKHKSTWPAVCESTSKKNTFLMKRQPSPTMRSAFRFTFPRRLILFTRSRLVSLKFSVFSLFIHSFVPLKSFLFNFIVSLHGRNTSNSSLDREMILQCDLWH